MTSRNTPARGPGRQWIRGVPARPASARRHRSYRGLPGGPTRGPAHSPCVRRARRPGAGAPRPRKRLGVPARMPRGIDDGVRRQRLPGRARDAHLPLRQGRRRGVEDEASRAARHGERPRGFVPRKRARPPNGTTPPIPISTAPTVTMPIRPSTAVRSAYSPSRPMCVSRRTAAIATPCCPAVPWPTPARTSSSAGRTRDGRRRGRRRRCP